MAKGTGTYDDPIICDGIFSKTIDGVKKFFKLNSNGSGSADHATTNRGQIAWFAQPEVPNGYLVCNGANVSRETYADLFAVIGTTYGSGDGSTTFTLPNLIDKFAQGSTTVGTYKSAGLPNITGELYPAVLNETGSGGYFLTCDTNGAFSPAISNYTSFKVSNLEYMPNKVAGSNFNASRSSSIYGNSTTVQPPALTLLPCIKY